MTPTEEKKPAPQKPTAKRRHFPKGVGLPSVLEGLEDLLTGTYGRVPLRRTLQYFGRPDRK